MVCTVNIVPAHLHVECPIRQNRIKSCLPPDLSSGMLSAKRCLWHSRVDTEPNPFCAIALIGKQHLPRRGGVYSDITTTTTTTTMGDTPITLTHRQRCTIISFLSFSEESTTSRAVSMYDKFGKCSSKYAFPCFTIIPCAGFSRCS